MIYNVKTLCAVALAATFAAAQPSFAGPIGSGLWLTEEVAARRLQQRTIKVALASPACPALTDALQERPEVIRVKAEGQSVRVTFRSAREAAEHSAAVRSIAGVSCRSQATR